MYACVSSNDVSKQSCRYVQRLGHGRYQSPKRHIKYGVEYTNRIISPLPSPIFSSLPPSLPSVFPLHVVARGSKPEGLQRLRLHLHPGVGQEREEGKER